MSQRMCSGYCALCGGSGLDKGGKCRMCGGTGRCTNPICVNLTPSYMSEVCLAEVINDFPG